MAHWSGQKLILFQDNSSEGISKHLEYGCKMLHKQFPKKCIVSENPVQTEVMPKF